MSTLENISPEALADLAEALRPAVLRLSRDLRRAAQRIGASALDTQLLAILTKLPGLGLSELAEREGVSKPAMSAHLRRLEEAGWIKRDEDAHDDRRRVGLFITDAGSSALDDVRRERNDLLVQRLSRLSVAERASLAEALEALRKLSGETL